MVILLRKILLIIFLFTLSSCCSWAEKNCPGCKVQCAKPEVFYIYPDLLNPIDECQLKEYDTSLSLCHPNNLKIYRDNLDCLERMYKDFRDGFKKYSNDIEELKKKNAGNKTTPDNN